MSLRAVACPAATTNADAAATAPVSDLLSADTHDRAEKLLWLVLIGRQLLNTDEWPSSASSFAPITSSWGIGCSSAGNDREMNRHRKLDEFSAPRQKSLVPDILKHADDMAHLKALSLKRDGSGPTVLVSRRTVIIICPSFHRLIDIGCERINKT
jgi:hypothetical protein